MGRRAGWRMGDGPRDNVQFLSGLVAPAIMPVAVSPGKSA